MAGFIGGRTSAFDYIQSATPDNPQNGEMWFDTDGASDGSGEVKIYDGASSAWEVTGFTSHADLTDVTRSAHHPPVDVSAPLTQPSDQSLGLSVGDGLTTVSGALVAALGNGLSVDSNGQVYVPASAVSASMLAFDPATQTELDGHAGDTTNPHNVTDDQTGAASALSNHAGDTTNPHNVTDDQTGAASALSNHAGNSTAHHSPPTSTAGANAGTVERFGSGNELSSGGGSTTTLDSRATIVGFKFTSDNSGQAVASTSTVSLQDHFGNTINSYSQYTSSGEIASRTVSISPQFIGRIHLDGGDTADCQLDYLEVLYPATHSHSI